MSPEPKHARHDRGTGAHDGLERYLRALVSREADGRLLNVRSRCPGGMAQRFVPAADVDRAAGIIRTLGARTDVYVGVLLRDKRAGGRAAISGGGVVFVELDATAAREQLAHAPAPPSILVASGTPGHVHAYWLLDERVSTEQVEQANRKLCHRVAGDPVSVDCARILRPPGTLNHKRLPARPVQLLGLDEGRRYPLAQLTDGLEDPRPDRPAPVAVRRPAHSPARLADRDLDAQLRQISTADYVLYLTGRRINRERKVHCPFHEDDTPSLRCYDDGTFCCFGCMKGGTIYDFAGALWGIGTKRREFLALRQRLGDTFGLTDPARPMPAAHGQRPPRSLLTCAGRDLEVQR